MPNIKELHVNGRVLPVDVDPDRSLLSVLRDELHLTGTKYGCGEGECGACTVLIDGAAIRSCRRAVSTVQGRKIMTIEGLRKNGRLHPVQQAFLDADALQCGYCTPGMILSAVALVERNTSPTRAEIIRAMDGNVCRCGTYGRILTAIEKAAQQLREVK